MGSNFVVRFGIFLNILFISCNAYATPLFQKSVETSRFRIVADVSEIANLTYQLHDLIHFLFNTALTERSDDMTILHLPDVPHDVPRQR